MCSARLNLMISKLEIHYVLESKITLGRAMKVMLLGIRRRGTEASCLTKRSNTEHILNTKTKTNWTWKNYVIPGTDNTGTLMLPFGRVINKTLHPGTNISL